MVYNLELRTLPAVVGGVTETAESEALDPGPPYEGEVGTGT